MVYRRVLRPLLFLMEAETAHAVGALALRAAVLIPGVAGFLRRRLLPQDPTLRTSVLGQQLPSPVGLAAGFDKDAHLFDGALALGFGFVEVGTVTALSQPGNDKPRLLRLPGDRALLNRFGFNNAGAQAAGRRLARRSRGDGLVGANVGKSAATPLDDAVGDYRASAAAVAGVSDFVVVNVSSPNTLGLRSLQDPAALRPILRAVLDEVRVPVLLKVAPDLADEELDALVDLALELGLAGMIATNTTIDRSVLAADRALADAAFEGGGISGAPLKERSLEVLRRLRARAGDRLVLVAVGGIETAQDAWERVLAGATLVQVYTAFVYGGPGFPARLARELAEIARREGYARVQDAVGAGAGAGGAPPPASA